MKEYTDEQKARLFDALLADGVDNWSGYQEQHYQEAMEEIEAEEKFEENSKRIQPLLDIILQSVSHDYPAGREAGVGYCIEDETEIVNWITKNFDPK